MNGLPLQQSIGNEESKPPESINQTTGIEQSLPKATSNVEDKLKELYTSYENLAQEVRNSKGEIKNTKDISHLGFIVLLVMVVIFLVQGFQYWVTSYNALNENIMRLQLQLNQPPYGRNYYEEQLPSNVIDRKQETTTGITKGKSTGTGAI